MRKIILILLPLLCISFRSCLNQRDIEDKIKAKVKNDSEYIENLMKPFKVKYKKRIKECILNYSYKYGLDPKMFARLVKTESGFDRLAKSHKGARGLTQVIPKWWNREIYFCRDKKMGKYLLGLKTKVYHDQYYFWIGISIEVGARILRKHLKTYKHLPTALCVYNLGAANKYFLHLVENPGEMLTYPYVKKIIESY